MWSEPQTRTDKPQSGIHFLTFVESYYNRERRNEKRSEDYGLQMLNMSQPSWPRFIITLQLLPLGLVARRGTSRTIAGTSFNASDRPRGLSLSFRVYSPYSLSWSTRELFHHSSVTCKNCHSHDCPRKRSIQKKIIFWRGGRGGASSFIFTRT